MDITITASSLFSEPTIEEPEPLVSEVPGVQETQGISGANPDSASAAHPEHDPANGEVDNGDEQEAGASSLVEVITDPDSIPAAVVRGPTVKHQRFVMEPMGDKAAIQLPGIGVRISQRLEQAGFDTVSCLFPFQR